MIRLAAGFFGELPLPLARPDTVAVQFTLSTDRLSVTEILDAGHASAGRLGGEILRRLRAMYPQARACLAFNPRFVLSPAVLQAVLLTAQQRVAAAQGYTLFCDRTGKTPLAYLLRSDLIDWCPPAHLGLLTGDHGELDHHFLHASFTDGELIAVPGVEPPIELAHDFYLQVSPALHDFTQRAIAQLAQARTEAERRTLIEKGERIALLGYHAGDVLFLLQAMVLERGEHPFTGVAVPAEFADIVQYLSPQLRCYVLKQPVPQRGSYQVADEFVVLRDYVTQLQSEGLAVEKFFWHPLRPRFRDFLRSRHHLREMTALALGGRGHALRPLPLMSEPSQRDYARAQPQPGRVIVQFDAGWGLKGFPAERRGELLRLLREVGYDPVLLGQPESDAPDVRAIPYCNLQGFRALLDSAQALLGCDSFPTHFANLYGVPTLTLFGSTRPSNSRGLEGTRYRTLHHPMSCVPCNAPTRCRLDNGTSCYAMPMSGEVVHALQQLVPAPQRRAI